MLLHKLQNQLQEYLLRNKKEIKKSIISTKKVTALDRLTIYRNAYYLRLLESLQHDYPVLYALMGTADFEELAYRYIDTHPSTFRSIRWYGNQLAEFIKHHNAYVNQPWLAEMALFEWALAEAFDAKDNSVITIEDMVAIPQEKWPELRFKCHPSVQKIQLMWNVPVVWNMYKEKGTCIQPQQSTHIVSWIISRKNYDVQFSSLSEEEDYMFTALLSQQCFSSICEGLCEWIDEEEVPMHAATILKQFIMDGMIISLDK